MTDTCEHIEPLLSGYLDNELSDPEREAIEHHLESCTRCRRELDELRGVVLAADQELLVPAVDDDVWDRFFDNVYNRLERRLGWTLFVLGALIVGCLIVYEAVVLPWASPALKVVLATPVAGLAVLFVSVLRQRIHVAQTDRYSRDVRR